MSPTTVTDDEDITSVITNPAQVRAVVSIGAPASVARVVEVAAVTSVVEDVGPPGPTGVSTLPTYVAAENIPAYAAVAVDAFRQAYRPEPTDGAPLRVVGLATVAALAGEPLTVQAEGELVTTGAFPVGPLFVGTSGALVPTPPTTGYQLQMAVALNPHTLFVHPQLVILL